MNMIMWIQLATWKHSAEDATARSAEKLLCATRWERSCPRVKLWAARIRFFFVIIWSERYKYMYDFKTEFARERLRGSHVFTHTSVPYIELNHRFGLFRELVSLGITPTCIICNSNKIAWNDVYIQVFSERERHLKRVWSIARESESCCQTWLVIMWNPLKWLYWGQLRCFWASSCLH